MTGLDWMNANYADGPKLARWFDRALCDLGHSLDGREYEGFNRRIQAWRQGDQVAFKTVDRYCVLFDLHPSMIPDNVWRHPKAQAKWADEPVRYCERCGGDIPTRDPSGKMRSIPAYRRTRWCSFDCRTGRSSMVPKECANVGCSNMVPLVTQSGKHRSVNEYALIKFCSKDCANVGQMRPGLTRMKKAA